MTNVISGFLIVRVNILECKGSFNTVVPKQGAGHPY